MEGIEKLKDIHKGQDIYVVASGSSMDYIPANFFENKITIGVNHVYRKYKTNYLVGKDSPFIKKSLDHPNTENTHILITKHLHGNLSSPLNTYSSSDNVSIFKHKNNKETIVDITDLDDSIITSWSTITTAIHIAAYMGAKNIMICGHDCGTLDGNEAFKEYHIDIKETPWSDWDQYVNWLSKIENQTIVTKNALEKHYGCNIVSINPFINFGLEGHTYLNKNKQEILKNVDIVFISWAKNEDLKKVTMDAILSLINENSNIIYHIYIVESNHSVRYEDISNKVNILPHTINTIHPDVNFGYHRYLNIGRKAGNSEYVCLCNNDLTFDKNWSKYIIGLMEENPTILSASPWCPQTQGDNKEHIQKAYIGHRVRGEIAGWCIFQQRKIYDIIGDLDERFEFWYADNDYSMTLQKHNVKHALVPASVVHHHESNLGKTGETLDVNKKKEYTLDQQKVYLEKWG